MSDTYEATALFLRQRVLILQARMAEAEYAKAGLEGAVRIVDARVNKALNILDLIDTDGDDHYYSNGE